MKTITWKTSVWLPLVLVAGSASGCVGNIGDSGSPGDGQGGGGPTALECKIQGISPGDTLARRMTRFEYNNTVRDLLGDKTHPADDFPADEVSGVFDNQASVLVVTELLAEGYMNAAESLAATAVKDLNGFVGCDPTAKTPAVCGAQFIGTFGAKAFRHAVTADEKKMLTDVFNSALAKWDYPTAIRLVVTTALQSPSFLYRMEFGMPEASQSGVMKLNGYEMASRLSYLLWGSMPDDELFAAAKKDALATPEQISAQAKRMLDDPRAKDSIENFHTQWLGLTKLETTNKNTSVFPIFTPKLVDTWQGETMAFIDNVIFDGEGDLATLLSASYTMMNADVAAYYGIKGGPTTSKYEKVALNAKQRAGLLTQPSVMGVYAHDDQTAPVQRGRFVRERLLCELIPPPPANVNATPPPVDPHATTRERFGQHEKDKVCAQCHHLMDPIGFGLENYDGVGLWRSKEAGKPVDANGEITDSKDADGKFDGGVELAQRLAQSEEVRACFVSQWFRYAQGRQETDSDKCSMSKLGTTFAGASYDIKTLLVALTQSDAFRYRKPVTAGK